MNRRDAPVLIVGAGPVGLALALGLARQGVASIVLERRTQRTNQPKAAGVLPRTLEILSSLGVLDRFKHEGMWHDQVSIWSDKRDTPVMQIDLRGLAAQTDQAGVLLIPQFRTEEILEAAVQQTGLVDVRHGCNVVDVYQNEREVRLDATDIHGTYITLHGSYVVGCDGIASVVRHKLNLELQGFTYPARMWLADVMVDDERDALPSPRFVKTPDGHIAAVRVSPHMWRLLSAIDSQSIPASSPQALVQERAHLVLGPGPGPVRCVWEDTFHLHSRAASAWRRGRVMLAGDAAHVNSPAGGQGMNCGIQDAHNLAWKLGQAVRRNGNAQVLLQSYEAERRDAFVNNVQKTSHFLTRMVLLANPFVRTGFLLGARLLWHWPWAQRRILARMGMFDTVYQNSPLLLGHHMWLGKRAPVAQVVNTSGDTATIHDHTSAQATLLYFDDDGDMHQDALLRAAALTTKNVRMWRVTRNKHLIQYPGGVLWDADGSAWRAWHANRGMVALVRPDGIVGWVSYKIPATVAATCAMLWHALGLRPRLDKAEHRRARHRQFKASQAGLVTQVTQLPK